jgi:hypothetical protein
MIAAAGRGYRRVSLARMYVAPLIAAGTQQPKAIYAQWAALKAPPVNASAFSPANSVGPPSFGTETKFERQHIHVLRALL